MNFLAFSAKFIFIKLPFSVLQNIISRLDQAERKRLNPEANNVDETEDFLSNVFLTKGPPDKLDAPPRKLRFLAIFGLTTLAKRNGKLEFHSHLKNQKCRYY